MEGLGLFKGQKIASSSGLIDIGMFNMSSGSWVKESVRSSLEEGFKIDTYQERKRLKTE